MNKFFISIFALAFLSVSCSQNSGKGTQSDSALQDSTALEVVEAPGPLSLSVISATPTNSKSYLQKTLSLGTDPIEVDTTDIAVINIPVDFSNIESDGSYNLLSKTEKCVFGIAPDDMEGAENVTFGIYVDLLDASGNIIGEAVYSDGKEFMSYGSKGTKIEPLPFKVNMKPENVSLLNGLSLRKVDVNIYFYPDF